MSRPRVKKAARGASAPAASGYVDAPKGPPGVVVSIKLPEDVVEEIDGVVEARRKVDPYASRGAITRELIVSALRARHP